MEKIDLTELMRAVHLDAEPAGADRFMVTDGSHQYFVTYGSESCSCGSTGLCRHVLRVALMMGEPTVIERLRYVVPDPSSRAAA